MARLVVKNGHQNDICFYEIGLCAQNYRHHSRFNTEHHNWEGLSDGLRRIFTLTSHNPLHLMKLQY